MCIQKRLKYEWGLSVLRTQIGTSKKSFTEIAEWKEENALPCPGVESGSRACSAAARAEPSPVQYTSPGKDQKPLLDQPLSAKSTLICLYTNISITFVQTLFNHILSQNQEVGSYKSKLLSILLITLHTDGNVNEAVMTYREIMLLKVFIQNNKRKLLNLLFGQLLGVDDHLDPVFIVDSGQLELHLGQPDCRVLLVDETFQFESVYLKNKNNKKTFIDACFLERICYIIDVAFSLLSLQLKRVLNKIKREKSGH